LVKKLGLDKFHGSPSSTLNKKPLVGDRKSSKDAKKKLTISPKPKDTKQNAIVKQKNEKIEALPVTVRSVRGGKKKKKAGPKKLIDREAPPKKLVMLISPGGKWFEDTDIVSIKLTKDLLLHLNYLICKPWFMCHRVQILMKRSSKKTLS